MIPRRDKEAQTDPDLPVNATFWTPQDEDLTDEGFGYFRGTWLIMDVSYDDAATMLPKEADLVRLADRLAQDEVEFDELAKGLEYADKDALPERFSEEPFISLVAPYLVDEDDLPLEGLELGVAGLVYALACFGCFPAASCRSHPTNSWSEVPVVIFAADRQHAEFLATLVSGTACAFDIDPARPNLLCLFAPSIEDIMLLARSVLAHNTAFSKPDP